MSVYELRPHHGLCLHFFRGQGYSAEFVENMTEIQRALAQNPTIQLVAGADNVCRTCPNRVGERGCRSDHKVLRYDRGVLERCDLAVGDRLPWVEFFRRVEENILQKNQLETVCAGCQWMELCRNLLEE